jgi:hypothetical protein
MDSVPENKLEYVLVLTSVLSLSWWLSQDQLSVFHFLVPSLLQTWMLSHALWNSKQNRHHIWHPAELLVHMIKQPLCSEHLNLDGRAQSL